jgi:hypothetical protein
MAKPPAPPIATDSLSRFQAVRELPTFPRVMRRPLNRSIAVIVAAGRDPYGVRGRLGDGNAYRHSEVVQDMGSFSLLAEAAGTCSSTFRPLSGPA